MQPPQGNAAGFLLDHISTTRASVARLLVPLLIAGVASACSGGASSAPGAYAPAGGQSSPAGAPTSGIAAITVATSTSLGTYLTAPDGKTLYTLSSDPMNQSTCADQCAIAWPPFVIDPNGKVVQPAGATGMFGTITRADGKGQVALDGHPLYEFKNDTAPGQTTGEGIVAFGGTWHVAKAA
jgi:predicted lipoprotein with Yx(FWY)xxD motif